MFSIEESGMQSNSNQAGPQGKLEAFWSRHYPKCVIICYWLLGLCNNFAYVIMLSAAHDILDTDDKKDNGTSNATTSYNIYSNLEASNKTNKYDCNDLSTGTILLADILPGIVAKFIAPFFMHKIKYNHRVIVVVISNFASFLLVALTPKHMKLLIFTGVGFASFASSFGEITFLSMTTLYSRALSITGWASGTGAAGFIGSFGYAGLTSIGLTPRDTMLIMLVIPVLMTFSYIMLPSIEFARSRQYVDPNEETTNSQQASKDSDTSSIDSTEHLISDSERQVSSNPHRGFIRTKLANAAKILRPLIKFMIPLFLVYYAEYFINQGLFELLYFKDSFVGEHKLQYRWYNVVYQAAVFISRSSIRLIKITFLPIFPILQILNIFIVLSQIYFEYFPSIWVAFAVIFWEGLLGGGCYVNAFNMVSAEVPVDVREFSIAVTSIADSFGIALAGFTAIPVHNAICDYGSK